MLEEIITKRCEAEAVFTPPDLVKEIARFSGGNIREMFRLVREACQFAEGERIDQSAFDSALRNIKMDFERRLVTLPYRALERVYKEKGVQNLEDLTLETLNKFLASLAILEYNGEEFWHDVHPAVQMILSERNKS